MGPLPTFYFMGESRTMKSQDENSSALTHVNDRGQAHMIEVGSKDITSRQARARGRVICAPETVDVLKAGELRKGDALAVARIAGIAAAKRTSDLIPLCHPIAITGVDVDVEVCEDAVEITATVSTADRTGIEMEALTSVSVAALNIIDMVKGIDRGAHIGEVVLEYKSGGRSGTWQRG